MVIKVASYRTLVITASELMLSLTIIALVGSGSLRAFPSHPFGLCTADSVEEPLLVKDKKDFSCKKAKCDPDEVKLDRPNIYGACCQAGAAALTPKAKEATKCQFPGEVDPPNCTCPKETEFMGYKGCVPVRWNCILPGVSDYTTAASNEAEARGKLSALYPDAPVGKATCKKVYVR